MNHETDEDPGSDLDQTLGEAGRRLRHAADPLDAGALAMAVLRRRSRRRGVLSVALALVLVIGGVAVAVDRGPRSAQLATGRDTVDANHVDAFLAGLPAKPVDPTTVHLVAAVQSFPGCDALIGNLRAVGARHVGSQGFGGFGDERFVPVREAFASASDSVDQEKSQNAGAASGETLGTNVQVSGVDELDHVKAVGKLIYDLDGNGNLRITDATNLQVVSTTAVAAPINAAKGQGNVADVATSAQSLLVDDNRVAVFGSQTETSKPVPDDPSASQATTGFLTVTLLDASDPAHPRITDRVKIDGSLVSARLVGGQIRLVTSSHMADIGMVMPTTPASIPTALERNRRSVATSTVADWIPDWQRPGGRPQPLVPCDRVNVPATFAGVAMTSMVTFPIGTDRFDPAGTSIVAPSTTLYAGLDKVAISSNVWVDPAEQRRLHFDDWQTAVHEFTFPKSGAPTYVGSGVVDGSTVGQFAFGELGDALSVVSEKGTPWDQRPDGAVDLTLLTPDGNGKLAQTARIHDLANGHGVVTAVRYLNDRVLISTGTDGRDVQVIDASKPTEPRRAGTITLAGSTTYFHPLSGDRALLVETRSDNVPGPYGLIMRPWVRAEVLDVSDPDAPKVTGSWEVPWATDQVGDDHHAFTFWPEKNLAMWGLSDAQQSPGVNHAVILQVGTGVAQVAQVALPEASKPPVVPAPCPEVPVDSEQVRTMLGDGTVVLGCALGWHGSVEWPRYECSSIDPGTVRHFAPEFAGKADYFACRLAPWPTVSRVLVVDGRPILMTDQTLEALDPTTFAAVAVVAHPSSPSDAMPIRVAVN